MIAGQIAGSSIQSRFSALHSGSILGTTIKKDEAETWQVSQRGGELVCEDWEDVSRLEDVHADLYDILLLCNPTPVVELNRAVAIAMRDTPEAGLSLIDSIRQSGRLQDYHLAHAARADLLRRTGDRREAHVAYERVLSLAQSAPVQRFLSKRLKEMADSA